MKKELPLLNFVCIVVAIVFVAAAVLNAINTGAELSTDNLFVTMVCMVMALFFAVNPLLHLKSEGKLPIPFLKSSAAAPQLSTGSGARVVTATTPPLLDAKGRAVPPDVKSLMANMGRTETKEA